MYYLELTLPEVICRYPRRNMVTLYITNIESLNAMPRMKTLLYFFTFKQMND